MNDIIILLSLTCICHIVFTQSDVRLPPTIRRRPERNIIIYRKYENITLECRADGTPAVTYEWKKNGFIFNTNLSNIHKESKGTITINRATDADEGSYQCFVMNRYGTSLSDFIDIRMAFINSTTEEMPTLLQKTVVEGMPVHIPANPRRSFPESLTGWCKADDINGNCTQLLLSKRKQVDENGDLHFAYVLPEDADGGGIYTSYTFNPFLNLEILGSSTQLTVTKNPAESISQFAPILAFSSPAQPPVALIGGNITFRCFFYGYPEPSIIWIGSRYTVRSVRTKLNTFSTEFNISNITRNDQGDYDCVASNSKGNSTRVFQLRVEDVPKFRNMNDGPYDVNVTEGESVTFNCNATAKPEANITWLQNGKFIDTDNPPERFVFSSDSRRLTIRDVCRDCVDRESKTDLTVIQCNASNVHGYAFAQGYLNVLLKTDVTITGLKNVSVDFLEEKKFVFQCRATSDPSTPPTVRWFKTKPSDHFVRDVPPYVHVTMNNNLVINIDPKCSANCAKYLGEYRCVGDNGFNRDNRTITIGYQYRLPSEVSVKKTEGMALWKIFLGIGAVGLVVFLIGLFLGFCTKGNLLDAKRRKKESRITKPLSTYEDEVCEPVDLPLNEAISYDDMGHPLPLEEVTAQPEADESPNTIEQSEAMSPYLDLNRDKVNQIEDLEILDIISKEVNPYMVPVSKEVNPHLVPVSREMNPKFAPVLTEMNPYLAPVSTEVNPYLVPVSADVNPSLVPVSKEVNPYLVPVLEDANPSIVSVSKEVNPNFSPFLTEVNPCLFSTEVNPYLVPASTEVNPYLVPASTEVNPYLVPVSTEVNPNLVPASSDMNPYLVPDSKEHNPILNP